MSHLVTARQIASPGGSTSRTEGEVNGQVCFSMEEIIPAFGSSIFMYVF